MQKRELGARKNESVSNFIFFLEVSMPKDQLGQSTRFDRTPTCDRQTDRQPEKHSRMQVHGQYRAIAERCAVKKAALERACRCAAAQLIVVRQVAAQGDRRCQR